MKDFNSIIETAIKACSSILIRDSVEILKLKSSASSSLDEFCSRSIIKFYQVLRSKLKIFSNEYSFVFLGKFPGIEKLNDDTADTYINRFVINVDGYSLFSTGLTNYSISLCIQKKNSANVFETHSVFIFSPYENRLYYGEKDKGLTLNKVKFKRSSVIRNYSIMSTSKNLLSKYNKYYNLICLKNFNLGFIYLATGSVDFFVAKITDKREALAGLFVAQICAIPVKINRHEDCFTIESGFSL